MIRIQYRLGDETGIKHCAKDTEATKFCEELWLRKLQLAGLTPSEFRTAKSGKRVKDSDLAKKLKDGLDVLMNTLMSTQITRDYQKPIKTEPVRGDMFDYLDPPKQHWQNNHVGWTVYWEYEGKKVPIQSFKTEKEAIEHKRRKLNVSSYRTAGVEYVTPEMARAYNAGEVPQE